MSVTGGLADFVRDDTLVDATMRMAHGADDQTVDVTNYRRKQRSKGKKGTGLLAPLRDLPMIMSN